MLGSKAIDTPIEKNHKLGEARENAIVECWMYQCLVGKLIYLSYTKPNIVDNVSVISQFMHSPSEVHLEAIYKILCYLKSTPRKGIFFKKNEELSLKAYTNANWARSVVDQRSTFGYWTFLGGNLVTCKSKKQFVVA